MTEQAKDEEPKITQTYPSPGSGGEKSEEKPLDVKAPKLLYTACLAHGIMVDIKLNTWKDVPSDVWKLIEHRGIILTDEQVGLLEHYGPALRYLSRTHTVTEEDGTKRSVKGVTLSVCWHHNRGWYPSTKTGGACTEVFGCKAGNIVRATRLKPIVPLPNYRKPPDPNKKPRKRAAPRKKAAPTGQTTIDTVSKDQQ